MDGRLQVFAGNANLNLARAIMGVLEAPLGRARVDRWETGETRVRLEENVRGSDVFVIQSICQPVNEHLVELLIILDAVRRASTARVTAVIPYYAYARQEKKTAGREPISAKLVANLLVTAGADRVLTLDLHAPAIEGFFDIPVDHLRATPHLASHFRHLGLGSLVVVSPDSGGVRRAEEFRQRAGGALAIISKQHSDADAFGGLEMVGDVEGRDAVIVDDMIATGETVVTASELLLARGARSVRAAAAHGVFARNALERINNSPIESVHVTDTIPLPDGVQCDKIEVLTVAPLLAEAIIRIHKDLSISALFM
jgi:ribose-phosphate pyrophosphokinase